MRHITFSDSDKYGVALLIKPAAFTKSALQDNYLSAMLQMGLQEDVVAITLDQGATGKPTAKEIKAALDLMMPALDSVGTTVIYVTDASYFKAIAKKTKAEPYNGYVLPVAIPGYTHMKVVLGLNYQALVYNPELSDKLARSLKAVVDETKGIYADPGLGIIHSEQYPRSYQDIRDALNKLHKHPELACDIEAFSLRHHEAGVGTISFSWDEHNGIAFPVDYEEIEAKDGEYGKQGNNIAVKTLLRDFFESYKGRLTFHNASYDVKVLITNLWMKDLLDTNGLLQGLEIMSARLDDTKIIAYLAYNSTAGNVLGLKALAHEFAGNWANDDIKDIRRIPLPELLRYNLIDGLCTNFVKKRDYPLMIQDKQGDLYTGLMLSSLKLIIQLELTGMPMSRKRIQEVKEELLSIQSGYSDTLRNSREIKVYNLILQTKAMEDANAKLKVKQHPFSKFSHVEFNPNSGPQLQGLLYTLWGLPVIDVTDTKAPATGADTIEKLINHTNGPHQKEVLQALIGYGKVTKILSTFIPAFEAAVSNDTVWLHGSFNLGGTVSGRLSSSDPKFWALQ